MSFLFFLFINSWDSFWCSFHVSTGFVNKTKFVPAVACHFCSTFRQHSHNHVQAIKGCPVNGILLTDQISTSQSLGRGRWREKRVGEFFSCWTWHNWNHLEIARYFIQRTRSLDWIQEREPTNRFEVSKTSKIFGLLKGRVYSPSPYP